MLKRFKSRSVAQPYDVISPLQNKSPFHALKSSSSSLMAVGIHLIGELLPPSVPEHGSESKVTIYLYYELEIEGE